MTDVADDNFVFQQDSTPARIVRATQSYVFEKFSASKERPVEAGDTAFE